MFKEFWHLYCFDDWMSNSCVVCYIIFKFYSTPSPTWLDFPLWHRKGLHLPDCLCVSHFSFTWPEKTNLFLKLVTGWHCFFKKRRIHKLILSTVYLQWKPLAVFVWFSVLDLLYFVLLWAEASQEERERSELRDTPASSMCDQLS